MLQHTRGIVIRTTPYGDTSLIVNVYTEAFGMQAYMVNGVRSSRSKGKAGLYRVGNILQMVVYHKEGAEIMRIKECNIDKVYISIPFSVIKGAVFLFCIELIHRSVREQEANEDLFAFIYEQLVLLDREDTQPGAFHLRFGMQLTRFLGFYPSLNQGEFFDLMNGRFTETLPAHTHYIDSAQAVAWRELSSHAADFGFAFKWTRQSRRVILHYMLEFYRLHIEQFGQMRSPEVLESVFND